MPWYFSLYEVELHGPIAIRLQIQHLCKWNYVKQDLEYGIHIRNYLFSGLSLS